MISSADRWSLDGSNRSEFKSSYVSAVQRQENCPSMPQAGFSNVSTLLREHRDGLERMAALPAETVDIESYHVARAVAELAADRSLQFKAILRVSDVATSSELGAHREDRPETSDYDARRDGEERVVVAFGLVDGER